MQYLRSLIEELEGRRLLSADLTGSFTGKIPGALSLKSPTRITVKITNSGTTAISGPAIAVLFASQNGTLESTDPQLASASVKLNLKPGKSANVTESVTVPSAISSGSYSLSGDIVMDGTIVGAFFSSSAVSITAPFVDLTGSVSVLPKTTSFTVGKKSQKPLAISVIVTNQGNVTAKGPVAISLFGSSSTVFDSLDPLLTSLPAKTLTLNAGKSKKYTINFKPTAATPSGTFYILAELNSGTTVKTAIVESTLDNNIVSSASTITITNPAKPLKVSLVGSVSDNIIEVLVGTPELVTFSAQVADPSSATAVELDEVDSSGNLIGKLADMEDDGSAADGDAVAGDGIYSANVPIGFDAPGTRYFVAKVTDSTEQFSAQTAAVSIPGVTGPTTQQLADDAADATAVQQATEPLRTSGATAPQMIAAVQNVLQGDSNVQAGSIETTDSSISWESADGIEHAVLTDELLGGRGLSAGSPTVIAQSAQAQEASAAAAPVIQPSDTAKNGATAIVLDPYNNFFSSPQFGGDEAPAIAQMLTDAGYDTTYLSTSQINSLTQYENIGTNAAIVIVSHGVIIPNMGSYIATFVLTSEDPAANHTADLLNHRLILNDDSVDANGNGVSSYLARSDFLADNAGHMDKSIVYLGCCHLGENTDMSNAFVKKDGAAAIIEYTGLVQAPFAVPHGIATFKTLLGATNNTVGDIPGINVDTVTATIGTTKSIERPSEEIITPDGLSGSTTLNRFLSFGDLKAVLPGKPKLSAVNLVITYTWPNNQRDLDSLTAFGGGDAGFDQSGGTYLNWLGDQQGAGQSETTIVDLYDAWKAGTFSTTTTVGVGADWYAPDDGKGPATINIAVEDINTEKQYEVQSLVINPSTETDGATSQQGVVDVTLGGDPTDPTVTIKLVHS